MVPHAGQPLDTGGHPQQGLQIRSEAMGSFPLAKPALEALELRGVPFGFATGSASGSQAGGGREIRVASLLIENFNIVLDGY